MPATIEEAVPQPPNIIRSLSSVRTKKPSRLREGFSFSHNTLYYFLRMNISYRHFKKFIILVPLAGAFRGLLCVAVK